MRSSKRRICAAGFCLAARYTAERGIKNTISTPKASGTKPHHNNAVRQPYSGMIHAAKNPPAAAPSGKPQYMVFTIMARLRAGQYSLNSVTALGMAAPKPKPVIKRKTPISHKLSAKADAVQNPENTSTDTVSTGFRPNLSAKGPDVTAPAAKPNNAALNTGARSFLPMPQSSDRLGAI